MQGNLCLWNAARQVCVRDPCINNPDSRSCSNDVGNNCLSLPYNAGYGYTCVNAFMLCNGLQQTYCQTTAYMCAWRGDYCAGASEPIIGKSDAECDVNFPQWSVALIIIWVAIMAILGFIIFLIVSKGRQQAIKSVEHSEVVVDSLNLRDNFNLQQPLNPAGPQHEERQL
jgi:hypothetical protein